MREEMSLPLVDEVCKRRKMRRSVKSVAESIQSLLGFKKNLTSNWAESVCDIIKDFPYGEPSAGSQIKNPCFKLAVSPANKDVEMSELRGELGVLISHLDHLNLQRRQRLNDYLDLKGNIRVFCRIRPILTSEECSNFGSVTALDSNNVLLNFAENKRKHYSFDKVFHPSSSQDEVFAEVEPVIRSALDGYNACIFAYGQTGTGKTFTMEGKPGSPGVVPRAIEALFRQGLDSNHKIMFSFSMLEIYLGSLRDLLNLQIAKPTDHTNQCLSIQMEPDGGIEIENLVSIRVNDFNQAKRLYRIGSRLRSTASTNSNVTSSRSHCMIRISMTCFDAPERRRETNKIWMVDLGGSERLVKTKARGRRFEEGKTINLSLSALGDVICALQRKKSHVPYRNSKLTRILRDSLGDDSKTLMLVHVSPKASDLCETVCSLNFATRVRSIHHGHEELPERRAKKEDAIAELLQKVRNLEYERQEVRKDIQKLTENLNKPHGVDLSCNTDLDSLNLSNQEPRNDLKTKNPKNKNVTGGSSLRLPRFMRPTVCSRQKSGTDYQFLELARKKEPGHAKRRKDVAKSVTFPLKGTSNSENGSDFSASRSSVLGSWNWKYSIDSETELSQAASDSEIKTVIFPEREKCSGLDCSKAHLNNAATCKSEDRRTDRNYLEKFVTDEMWVDLQEFEPTQTCIPQSKRVHAIPMPKKKSISTDQDISITVNGTETLPSTCLENPQIVLIQSFDSGNCEKAYDDKFTEKCDQIEQLVDGIENVNIAIESSETGALCDSPQHMEDIPDLYLNSKISIPEVLVAGDECARTCIPTMVEGQAKNPNAGICSLLQQAVPITWETALLGLGIRSFGLEHDFFYGLML